MSSKASNSSGKATTAATATRDFPKEFRLKLDSRNQQKGEDHQKWRERLQEHFMQFDPDTADLIRTGKESISQQRKTALLVQQKEALESLQQQVTAQKEFVPVDLREAAQHAANHDADARAKGLAFCDWFEIGVGIGDGVRVRYSGG